MEFPAFQLVLIASCPFPGHHCKKVAPIFCLWKKILAITAICINNTLISSNYHTVVIDFVAPKKSNSLSSISLSYLPHIPIPEMLGPASYVCILAVAPVVPTGKGRSRNWLFLPSWLKFSQQRTPLSSVNNLSECKHQPLQCTNQGDVFLTEASPNYRWNLESMHSVAPLTVNMTELGKTILGRISGERCA